MATSTDITGVKDLDVNDIKRPLDESFYSLDKTEEEFITQQTGIQDPQELKKHIMNVQAEAYQVRFK